MKNISLLLAFCFSFLAFSQAQVPPQAFNYSAVARNAAGQPIAAATIVVQISILKTIATGSVEYSENHFVNTDPFGLFNLVIGTGAVQSGSMAAINWSNDNYFLKVGMFVNGANNFITMGTTQLLSVPYALHSATADSVIGGAAGFSGNYNDLENTPNLSTVAISGSYSDLSNQPITVDSISSNGNILYLSNGQNYIAAGSGVGTGGSLTHYIGEQFGGGVIFHLWKDAQGVEHGLIVDKTDLIISQAWSNIDQTLIGPSAQSSWDGLNNSNTIVVQAGHTNSAAALCLNSTNGGQSDWYLPSIDELNLLWNNRFNVNKSLSTNVGATVLTTLASYWSSTEYGDSFAWNFYFSYGYTFCLSKNNAFYVRAVRAF